MTTMIIIMDGWQDPAGNAIFVTADIENRVLGSCDRAWNMFSTNNTLLIKKSCASILECALLPRALQEEEAKVRSFMSTFQLSVVDEEQQMNLLLPDREIDRDIPAADSFVPINE